MGANSLLQELTLIEKGGKSVNGRVASQKVYPFTVRLEDVCYFNLIELHSCKYFYKEDHRYVEKLVRYY